MELVFSYLWEMAGGFEHGAIKTIKFNRGILKRSRARYSKVKEQYIGKGLENLQNSTQPKQSLEKLKAGRKRALKYVRKRKLRITIEIVVGLVLSLIVLYTIFHFCFLLIN